MSKFIKGLKFLSMPLFLFGLLFAGHSASAVDVTYNAEDIWGNWTSTIMSNNWSITSGCISPIASNTYFRRIFTTCELTLNNLYVTIPNREYHADDLIMISFLLTYADESTSNHTTWFSNHYGGSNYLNLIDVDIEYLNGNTQQVTLWLRAYGTFTDSNILISGNDAPVLRLIPGTGGGNAAITPSVTQVWHISGDNTPSANDIADAINNGETDATQDAADTSNSAGSSAASSAESGTSNLLGIIGQFIDTLKNITPGTCSLNLNAGHLVLGNVDFCQLSPPAGITALFSVIAVFFFIPLAWNTVSQIIDMFRSFTNG